MTDLRISNLIESQFPAFVKDEGPRFIAFVKAYYEWLEETGNLTDSMKSLRDYRDIDKTPDKFLDYFRDEFLANVPKDVLVDPRLLLKHIKDFYKARGSEKATRLLFRILYDQEIDFYYPGDDILRASDGRWQVDKTLRVDGDDTLYSMQGYEITGNTSGATARVEQVLSVLSAGAHIYEIYLSNIIGDFTDNEIITATNGITGIVRGPIKGVTITFGGANHRVNDRIIITGTNETGRVLAVNNATAVQFTLSSGGSGYRANSTIVVSGGTGQYATFTINGITNPQVIQLNTDVIQGMANVSINSSSTFGDDPDIDLLYVGSSMSSSNVNSTLLSAFTNEVITIGTISGITTANVGYGYSTLPNASVVDTPVYSMMIPDGNGSFLGYNAVITPRHINGAIKTIQIDTTQTTNFRALDTLVNIENRTIVNPWNAQGTISEKGGLYKSEGRWIGTKGFLSSDKYLQDNYYYQEYSYEIKSGQFVDSYRTVLKNLNHTAGTQMFGKVQLNSTINIGNLAGVTSQIRLNLNDVNTQLADLITANTYITTKIVPTIRVSIPSMLSLGPVTTTSNTWAYTLTTGTSSVLSNNVISTYSANTISLFSGLVISSLGDSSALYGTGTTYTSDFVATDFIKIVDPDEVNPDQGFQVVSTPTNNLVLDIAPAYVGEETAGIIYKRTTL